MNFTTFSKELIRHRPRRSGGLIAVEQIDSTLLLGRRIVEEYAREGTVAPDADIVAWRQLAGRGRRGRTWSSPPGCGVYATLIRAQPEPGALQLLPLLTAVACCENLNRYLGGRCRLKWPNDLLVGDSKLGGLLIEAITQSEQMQVAIISLGINYSADLAALAEARATSLHHEMSAPPAARGTSAGSPGKAVPSLAGLAVDLIAGLDEELDRGAPASEVLRRYQRLSSYRPGDFLRCQLDSHLLEGRFLGFDEHGFLRLEVGGEERLLSTGEILSGG